MPLYFSTRVVIGEGIKSDPPENNLKVVNIYVDKVTGHLVVEYEDPTKGE